MYRTKLVPLLLGGLWIVISSSEISAAPRNYEDARVGRYQLVAGEEGSIYVIDTVLGQCWSKTKNGTWKDEGNPAESKTKSRQDELPSLTLPRDNVSLTIVQRKAKPIPGSSKGIFLHLGDITGGQVLLAVKTDHDEVLLDETSVKKDDVVEFKVGKKKFYIHVRELRNFAVGNDFAVLEISSKRPSQNVRSEPDDAGTERKEGKHERVRQ